MNNDELIVGIQEHVGPITALLDEAFAYAIAEAERRCRGIDHDRFGFVRSALVKVDARQWLEAHDLPSNWQVAGHPHQMGQLILRQPDVMDLRVLKTNYLQPAGIPHAGSNAARRSAWMQPTLSAEGMQNTHHQFLLLWNYLNPATREDGFSLRLVHPVSSGDFRHRVECDLDIEIPRGGTSFQNLVFRTDAEDENLFSFEIDAEEGTPQ